MNYPAFQHSGFNNIKLRQATNSDADAVKTLVFGVLNSYGLKPDPDATDQDLNDIEAYYLQNQGWFGVLDSGNSIVG